MKRTADCVIIGGGVIGSSLAYYLAKRGIRNTVVLEAEYLSSGATGRCGGGIRQQWSTEPNAKLAIESMALWRELEDELDRDIEFLQGGYLVLGYTDDDVRQFEANVELQRRLGLDVEVLTPSEIPGRCAPGLDTRAVRLATYCPSDGSANPFLTTQAYADAARRLGVEFELFTPAHRVLTENGRVTGVETTNGTIEAPVVVNAAGSHSLLLARTAGVELPITPWRREILVTEPLERFLDPMVISFSFGIYFRQTKHGAVIGGFADPEEQPGFNQTSSLDFLTTMSRKLRRLMPRLSPVKIVRQWAGLYDATPDGQPILGAVPELEGFIQANGFSGHGFMIAPKVSSLLAQLISGEEPDLDIERLNITRFEGGGTAGERSVV